MTKEQIENEILDVLRDKLGLDSADLSMEATFAELGVDSLDLVEVVLELQERLRLDIPERDVRAFGTPGEAATYISERLGAQ